MKKFLKRLTAICSAAATTAAMYTGILFGSENFITANSVVRGQCESYQGSNENANDYGYYAYHTIDSYLISLQEGGYMRFQNGAVENAYLIEYYDSEYNFVKDIKLEQELSIFGGFYATDDYYYILSGQENPNQLSNAECFRITKYDKDWNKIKSAGLADCNTVAPFYAGSARFAVSGKYMFIRTSHKMYRYTDGLNHQANVTIQLDTEAMKITDSFTSVSAEDYGYVSHSFNQFIHTENNRIIALDHGDANPRSIVLTEYITDFSGGKFTPTNKTKCVTTDIVKFPGSDKRHYNYTGAAIGGFEISDTHYIAAYSAESYTDNNVDEDTRNICIGTVDKKMKSTINRQITNYAKGSENATAPHLVKVNNNRYILLWGHENNVYYTSLDGKGNPDSIYTIEEASLSDCVPVVSGNKLVWYTWKNDNTTFYEINLTDISDNSSVTVESGHQMEIISLPTAAGENCIIQCCYCRKTAEFATPEYLNLLWNTKINGTYSPYIENAVYKGDSLYMWAYDNDFSAEYHDYILTFSDPEAVKAERVKLSGEQVAYKLTFLKEGKHLITATHKYNPAVTYSQIIQVEHDKNHTLNRIPAEIGSNKAHFVCQDCDYTEEFTVLTNIKVGWQVSGSLFDTKVKESYCPESQTKFVVQSEDEADNREITIEIGDKSIMEFTQEYIYDEDFWGKLDILTEGETEITIYPTYNPNIKKTFTIKAAHFYENGSCKYCSLTCSHNSWDIIPATCTSPKICTKCGHEIGEPDYLNHSSYEMIYVPSEENDSFHDIKNSCCGQLINSEEHIFNLDEESGEYRCICGITAVCALVAGGEIKYFSSFSLAAESAREYSDSLIYPLTDFSMNSTVIDGLDFVLDLNGKDILFTGITEYNSAIAVKSGSVVITDSTGGGSITAPQGADLIYCEGGTVDIRSGNLVSEQAVIRAVNDSNVIIQDGIFSGEYGIIAECQSIILNGEAEFQCSKADFLLSENSYITVNTALSERYSVEKKKAGLLAVSGMGISLNSENFGCTVDNRLIVSDTEGNLYLKYDIACADIILESEDFAYSGNAVYPIVNGVFEEIPVDYIISFSDEEGNVVESAVNSGMYTAIITGKRDFAGTVELPFRISAAIPIIEWTIPEQELIFSGESAEIIPPVVILPSGEAFEGEIHYSYRALYSDDSFEQGLPVEVGAYEVTAAIDGFGNYTGAETENSMILIIDEAPESETTTTATTTTATTTVTTSVTTVTTTVTTPDESTDKDNIRGDVNGDSIIDAADASVILAQYAAVQTGGNSILNHKQLKAADVNNDGIVDSSDASKILFYYTLISIGKEPSWN